MTTRFIMFKGAMYRRADPVYPVPPEAVEALRGLDHWFSEALEQLYRDGAVRADYAQAARWLRRLDEYLVTSHDERPVNFETRVLRQLEGVYSAQMSSDIVVYMTDGGISRFVMPDEPGKRLTTTPHYYGAGSTKQVEARWNALVALAR